MEATSPYQPGSRSQYTSYVKGNARVEALAVTPGFSLPTVDGWTNRPGRTTRGNVCETMETAVKLDPEILLICQWNEFAGQPGGPPGQYVDRIILR